MELGALFWILIVLRFETGLIEVDWSNSFNSSRRSILLATETFKTEEVVLVNASANKTEVKQELRQVDNYIPCVII